MDSLLRVLGGSIMVRVLLAVLTVLVVYALGKVVAHFWKMHRAFRGLPRHPKMHWLWGHSKVFLSNRDEAANWMVECAKLFPKMHVFHFGHLFYVLYAHHPDTARPFFGPEPKLDIIYYPLMPWLGESLLTGNGPKWSRTRRLLTPAFHFDILKPYVKVYCECVDVLLDKWSKVGRDDVVELFSSSSMLTLDVMLRCTCSYESNCQTANKRDPYIAAVYELSRLSLERMIYFPYYFDIIYNLSSSKQQYKKAAKLVHDFAMDIITRRRKELEEKKTDDNEVMNRAPSNKHKKKYLDFIDILLQARDEQGVGLSNEEIRAEVDTFVFEGHDTTASGLSWTLYNLAIHPEHQAKCREEVDALFDEKENEDLTWDDMNHLEYVGMCIKESLRLFPPVPAIGRELSQDVAFDGHVMPKGTKVVFAIYALHHNASVWGDDVEEFNPLRFTVENSKGRDPFAYVPFSAGPRNCIGQNFAMNEQKVAIAKILRRFELAQAVEGEVPLKELEVILRAKDGIKLKITPREL
ncbi:ultra-long-chain fatty acid omega-hydroxylase-like isoform X1 [Dysidea avara]|uniref:ultra-long-chain fatty acid omega-hydroxylase-like isoform X1 n=1 Tax=Dysidea avara TaxID=196820 RepID=UPI0033325C8E